MLEITIPGLEYYDENMEEFIYGESRVIRLEHSLLAISRWESKWQKPFLSQTVEKSAEEMRDYIKCMTVTPNVPEYVYDCLTPENVKEIEKYMQSSMTATTFTKEQQGKKNREVITNELVYCWMVELNIPFECEKWHINRLLTLINVCSLKQQPPKKMDTKTAMNQQRALNQARRAQHHTRG